MAIKDRPVEWPVVLKTSRFALVAGRAMEPFVIERHAMNHTVWQERSSWKLGFYFGKGDTRLWVPTRDALGEPREERRVINFSHPMGRKAFRVLATAYGIGTVALGFLVAVFCGLRW